jgi:formate hydrogenlyase transcriptional activator
MSEPLRGVPGGSHTMNPINSGGSPVADGEPGSLLQFEVFLSDILGRFLQCSNRKLGEEVRETLHRIGKHLEVDHVAISRLAQDGEALGPKIGWFSDRIDQPEASSVFEHRYPGAAQHLLREDVVQFKHGDEFEFRKPAGHPEWVKEESSLQFELGITSGLAIRVSDELPFKIFSLGVATGEREWSHSLLERFRYLGRVLWTAVDRAERAVQAEDSKRFEGLLVGISRKLITCAHAETERTIGASLSEAAPLLEVGSLGLVAEDSAFGDWCKVYGLRDEPLDGRTWLSAIEDILSLPPSSAQMVGRGFRTMDELEAIPESRQEARRLLEAMGVKGVLVTDVEVGESLKAWIFAGGTTAEQLDAPVFEGRLRLLGELLAGAIHRMREQDTIRNAYSEIEDLKERLEAENVMLRTEVLAAGESDRIIGKSVALKAVLHKVDQVARTDSSVLLLGETGTGKGLVAQAIHTGSARSDRPMITVNCAVLPATLIESELFGHEKGAFTGALQRRVGRFELADGGTILLDEIGDLPLDLQAKLLRVLQDGMFERLGSTRTQVVDARVIAATSTDLPKAIDTGSFREDLYYRLCVFPIEIPPLRHRRDDIPHLVWHFVSRMQGRFGNRITDIAPSTMKAFTNYDWPGNVRELQNVIERSLILSPGSTLVLADRLGRTAGPTATEEPAPGQTLQDIERDHILRVLDQCKWKVGGRGGAAERLDLKRGTLQYRMKKLGIHRP